LSRLQTILEVAVGFVYRTIVVRHCHATQLFEAQAVSYFGTNFAAT
jgi:hypothetical protein